MKLLKSTATVGSATILSRILGFVRDVVHAAPRVAAFGVHFAVAVEYEAGPAAGQVGVVVDDRREVVRREAVGLEEHLVLEPGVLDHDVVAEHVLEYLEGPVVRVAGFDTPFPYALEHLYMPDVRRVLKGIEKTFSW